MPLEGTDGDSEAESIDRGLSEEELYVVIREAVEDAMLGVIGTLLLVGIAFVLVYTGGALLVGGGTPESLVLGFVGVAVGFYVAASALKVIPPIREWF